MSASSADPLRTRRAARLWMIGLAIPLLAGALELRLPQMTRPFWEDEIHHNQPILSTPDMATLDHHGMYLAMQQPKLDFWMRKVFWFPVFGVNERALRIPALAWGLLLVLLVYGSLIVFLRRRVADPRLVALLAFLGSLWIAGNAAQIHYSSEARHYTLIAFASTLWCASLLLFEGKPRWLLGAASLLFANTHFFALPLVAAGYALQIFRELRARKYAWILFHLLVCFCIYECTMRINYATFSELLHGPPGANPNAPLTDMLQPARLRDTLELWLGYSRTLEVPPATWIVWLAILVVAIWRRESQWVPTLLAVFVGFPAIFAYMKFRSSHPFGERYYFPFFGIGLVTAAIGLDLALRAWRHFAPKLAQRRITIAAPVAVGALAVLCGAPVFAYRMIASAGSVHRVPKNFSPYFLAYNEITIDHKPTFIVHSHCWTNDIQSVYFEYILPPLQPPGTPGQPLAWADAFGCEDATVRRRLQQFLTAYGALGGVVVLDDKELDCKERKVPAVPPPITVEKLRSVSACMWKVHGATLLPQLGMVANMLQSPSARGLR